MDYRIEDSVVRMKMIVPVRSLARLDLKPGGGDRRVVRSVWNTPTFKD
jgi:hypothetical protein